MVVAVCLCTCARAGPLDRTLGLLARADCGGEDTALIVVDNAPDGSARAICERWAGALPMRLRVVEEPVRGIPFARNRAVAEARALGADDVAFIDDDDEPSPDWLRSLLDTRRETAADLVFGTWRLPERLDLPPRIAGLRYFRPMRLEARNRYGLPAWAGTYNVLLSRRLIDDLGGDGPLFRPGFARSGGGDMDLFIRADRRGFRHAVAAASVVTRVWAADRLTMRGVAARSFLRGGSSWRLAEAHLPAVEVRRLRRKAISSLAGAGMRLPMAVLRSDGGGEAWMRLARAAGVLHAAMGGGSTYYGGPPAAPAGA